MKKLILLSVLVLSGCLEKETTFKGCPDGLVYVNNMCAKPTVPPPGVSYFDLGIKGSEGGSVVITFANNSSLTCQENCAETTTAVPQGTQGSAQATAMSGYAFSGWEDFSGNASTVCFANPCSITVNSSFNLKPKFIVENSEPPITGQVMMFMAAAGLNSSQGNALWRTDGTIAGTVFVKDPNPNEAIEGYSGMSSYPMAVIDNILYFGASTGPRGTGSGATGLRTDNMELWSSNGLASGTNMYVDLNNYQNYQGPFADPEYLSAGSDPYGMIKKENVIIMSAMTSPDAGQEYVYLDANKISHTVDLLSYGNNGSDGSSLSDDLFRDRVLLPNGNLIFKARQWSEDPSAMGFGSGRFFSDYAKIFVTPAGQLQPELKFTSINEFQCGEYYDMDSCQSQTISCSYNEYVDYDNCMDYNPETDECYNYSTYSLCEGPTQRYTDQYRVSQIMYDEGAPMALFVKESNFDSNNYYLQDEYLYATDGVTEIEIEGFTHQNNSLTTVPYPNQVVYFQGQYHFIRQIDVPDANGPSGYATVWQLVKTQLPQPGLIVLVDNVNSLHKVSNSQLLYSLSEGGENPENDGWYLFDGTSSTLVQLGLNLSDPMNAPGRVYFRGYANDLGNLSYLDLNTNQIVIVKEDISINGFMGLVNGKLIFTAQQYQLGTGFEPWVSDGTESGTFMLKDIKPGSGDGLVNNPKGYVLQPNND